MPLARKGWEGGGIALTRESGDRPGKETVKSVGCDGRERRMTMTKTTVRTGTTTISIVFVALIGATIVFLAGHAQSATLHDAAHDVRHATGFPCH